MSPAVLALVSALQASAVDVTWHGGARCPQDGFQGSLARYLEGAGERRDVRVTITVRRLAETRWSATLVLVTADGRSARSLHGRTCAEISEAAAFVTAVVVDPGVLSRSGAGTRESGDADMPQGDGAGAGGTSSPQATEMSAAPEAAGMGVPVPPATTSSGGTASAGGPDELAATSDKLALGTSDSASAGGPGELARSPRIGLEGGSRAPEVIELEAKAPDSGAMDTPPVSAGPRGFVRVAGGAEALGMPRVGAQVGLAGGVFGRGWRVELTAFYRAPTTVFTLIDPSAGARVRMWAVGARGCGVPAVGRSGFPLCGGVEVGQAFGEGVGFPGRRTDRFAWVALVLGPAFTWAPRPWLALWLGVDLGLPLLRGSFGVRGLGTVFEIAPMSLRAALGLEFRFGARSR